MKYLRLFEGYQEEEEVGKICDRYGIENWTLNKDGLVDVDDNVYLENTNLPKLPLKFGEVTGGFCCADNLLTTLEGSPHTVGSYFTCYNNKLTSLEGCPHTVGEDFYCGKNNLKSLKGSPSNCLNFYCNDNQLTSLEGAPQKIRGDLDCNNNKISSFEGYPKSIVGDFTCFDNPIYNVWWFMTNNGQFNYKIDYQIIELLNDYDIFRDKSIILDRFNDFLQEIGKKPVKKVEGYKNI